MKFSTLYERENLTNEAKQQLTIGTSYQLSNNTKVVTKVNMKKLFSLAYETKLSQNLGVVVSSDYDFDNMKASGARIGFTYQV